MWLTHQWLQERSRSQQRHLSFLASTIETRIITSNDFLSLSLSIFIVFLFRMFGFVARKLSGSNNNECHVFAELESTQPARAIVNFVTRILIGSHRQGNSPWRHLYRRTLTSERSVYHHNDDIKIMVTSQWTNGTDWLWCHCDTNRSMLPTVNKGSRH